MEFGRIVGNLQQIEKDRAARMTSVLEKRLQVGVVTATQVIRLSDAPTWALRCK